MPPQSVRIIGLRDLQRELRAVDATMPRELRKANKSAAEIVAADARRRVPVRSGRLRGSVGVRAEQRRASVKMGGARTPYAGFIDFGNKRGMGGGVGRGDSQSRPYLRGGRILYPALKAQRERVADAYEALVADVIARSGLHYRRTSRG